MYTMLSMFPSSISERLSLHARHALKEARDIARYTKSESIGSRHLILALALEEGSLGSILLENMGFKKESLGKYCLKKVSATKGKAPKVEKELDLPLSLEIQNVIKRAFFLASDHNYPYVGTEHLLSALFESPDTFLDALIETLKVDTDKINTVIESHLHFEQFPQMARMFDMPDFSTNDRKDGSSTPFLDQYTIDLAEEAKEHPLPLIGREQELERLMQILGRKEKRNAILLGDPGVGKTALVTALAERMAAGKAGPLLRGKRVLSLDLALLVAGTSFRGEFETRIKELIKEVRNNSNLILFIDEIHALVGTGNTQGGLDAANILKPALARGEIQCIGATTLAEYKRHLEKDAALERRFQTVFLREPTPEEALAILSSAKEAYEIHHQVIIPPETIEEAVRLSVRYIPDRFLPDKALDLIDEASALVRRRSEEERARELPSLQILETKLHDLNQEKSLLIEKEEYDRAALLHKRLRTLEKDLRAKTEATLDISKTSLGIQSVTPRDILTVLSHITHIPLDRLAPESPKKRLARLKQTLREQVIGQESVNATILKLLTRSLSPISDPKRPIGSLLLLGPTGVGKTHLAKVLAENFFGDEQALIRLDMSEFMERHSVAQILGAPAGYVGYGEGGKLTEAVRRRPYSIVLFDEIEKAHPDIANILLQILDEGHLTDAEGRRVSFKNTLILLTSNIGTASFTANAKIGFGETNLSKTQIARFELTKQAVLQELKETLRPELIARLDQVLVFNPLGEKELEQIALLELEKVQSRLKERGIELKIRAGVAKVIVKESIEKGEGARLIRKHVTEHIESELAEKLIQSPLSRRFTLTLRHGRIEIV